MKGWKAELLMLMNADYTEEKGILIGTCDLALAM